MRLLPPKPAGRCPCEWSSRQRRGQPTEPISQLEVIECALRPCPGSMLSSIAALKLCSSRAATLFECNITRIPPPPQPRRPIMPLLSSHPHSLTQLTRALVLPPVDPATRVAQPQHDSEFLASLTPGSQPISHVCQPHPVRRSPCAGHALLSRTAAECGLPLFSL